MLVYMYYNYKDFSMGEGGTLPPFTWFYPSPAPKIGLNDEIALSQQLQSTVKVLSPVYF